MRSLLPLTTARAAVSDTSSVTPHVAVAVIAVRRVADQRPCGPSITGPAGVGADLPVLEAPNLDPERGGAKVDAIELKDPVLVRLADGDHGGSLALQRNPRTRHPTARCVVNADGNRAGHGQTYIAKQD